MENYFRNVNIYEVSEEEREKVAVFHEHTNQVAPRWRDKGMWGHLQKSIGWIRTFGGDPVEASTFTEAAKEKCSQQTQDLFIQYFEALPEDVQQDVASKWGKHHLPNPVSEEIWEKAKRRAEIEMDKTLYQKVYDYLDQQLDAEAVD